MKVKGFIVEDDQGRELVLACEQLSDRSAKVFALRGWQRRRLVPLQYTEQEHQQIIAQVLLVLNELYTSLPKCTDGVDEASPNKTISEAHLLRGALENEENRVMN